ncbi:MAG TPA: TOBE domain-containing protein, partial [Chloroflexi bacterium]|nr:TOBE domain-containing protein [Chloroflexota bacterium]
TPVMLTIRPEDIRLGVDDLSAPNTTTTRVEEIEFLGSFYRLMLRLDALGDTTRLVAEVSSNRMRDLKIEYKSTLSIHLPPSLLHVYPAEMSGIEARA